jgi:hypothetical protein
MDEITITAVFPYRAREIPVKVIWAENKKARIQAIKGEPFPEWTHGGWAYGNNTTVSVNVLHDIQVNGIPIQEFAKQRRSDDLDQYVRA